jgi:uncharacterized protein YbaR (Trm112 family)
LCQGRLVVFPEAYRCAACERSYPIVVGIPDFRLAPDPYISLAEEYEKTRLLADEANRRLSSRCPVAIPPADRH